MGDHFKEGRKLNYFSERERAKQDRFAQWRTKVLGPIVHPLIKLRVKADHITLTGVLLLIPYAYLFATGHLKAAAILVWVCVLFDGLDGVYARITETDSAGGGLADAFGDQLVAIVTTLLIIHEGLANAVWGAYYGIVYVVMIALSMVQVALGIPLQTILRSKFILYATVGIYAFFGINLFMWIFVGFSILMTFHSLQSFLILKKHLS